jgi:hypothetical protein
MDIDIDMQYSVILVHINAEYTSPCSTDMDKQYGLGHAV